MSPRRVHPLITKYQWAIVETDIDIFLIPHIGESFLWVISQSKKIADDTGKTVIVKGNDGEDVRVEPRAERRKHPHEPAPIRGRAKRTPDDFDLIELD